jgi:polysaccharide biosynthesis protein VpsQ
MLPRGMTTDRRAGRLVECLRWLFWPMLALVVLITVLAYLRRLPGGLRRSAAPLAGLLAIRGFDKVAHLILFGLLTFFFDLWLRGRDLRLSRLRLPLAPCVLFAAAATEEALQSLSPARTAELLDLTCDLLGMLLAVALSRWLLRRRA